MLPKLNLTVQDRAGNFYMSPTELNYPLFIGKKSVNGNKKAITIQKHKRS